MRKAFTGLLAISLLQIALIREAYAADLAVSPSDTLPQDPAASSVETPADTHAPAPTKRVHINDDIHPVDQLHTVVLDLNADEGTPLTLQESVERAIESATNVLKAQNEVDADGTQLLQGYAQFLPNLSAQANYGYTGGKYYYTQSTPTFVNGKNMGATANVMSTLNLFNGLGDLSALRSALHKKHAADLTLTRAKQEISLDVTQNFLQLVLDGEIVGIGKKNLDVSRNREKLLTEQTRLGVKNLSDLFRQQAQTSSDESFLMNAENKRRSDQILLLQKLRVDVSQKYKFVSPELPESKGDAKFQDESKLVDSALAQRSDLKAAALNSDAARLDVVTARSSYFPRLDFVASVNTSGTDMYTQYVNGVNSVPASQAPIWNQLQQDNNYALGLSLTWHIFDRFVTKAAVARQRVVANDLEIDAADRRNQVEADVRQSFGDYENALEQLRSSKKGLEAAQKAFEVIQGRYDVGSSSFIDLVTAQAVLLQAEASEAQSRIGLLLQGKSLEFAMGETPIP